MRLSAELLEKIDPSKIEELKEWVRSEAKGLEDSQAALLLSMLEMVSILLKSKTTHKKAVETLRQLMGILPKTEKSKSDKFEPVKSDPIEGDKEKHGLERQIHKLLNRYRQRYGALAVRSRQSCKNRSGRGTPRNGGDETCYQQSSRGAEENVEPNTVSRKDHFEELRGLRSSTEDHVRYDFDVKIKKITYQVETVTDPKSGYSVRASTKENGPEGWQITWNAMINIVHLVVVFAMPAHRAAAYLGNNLKVFGESTLLRVLQYVASVCTPIYLEIFRQMAQSRRIQGDDSATRVLAVERQIQNGSESDEINIETKNSTAPVLQFPEKIVQLDEILGFTSIGKLGRPKKRLHITMVTGRIEDENQHSQISFVRTHRGSLGNLLDKFLAARKPERKKITITCDQSTSNLVSLQHPFDLAYAGCSAHARRPFWRYRDTDPINCYQMLRCFKTLASIEDIIDCHDRTEEVTRYWRQKYGQKVWKLIRQHCENTMSQHMPNSELHLAAKYIMTHYDELTLYLEDDWLHPTNNQVERILRSEKIMLLNSKFRQSKKGRVAYDIIRTLQLCCSGASVSFIDYLKWALPNHEQFEKDPAAWTPYGYRQHQLKNQAAQK